MTEQEEQLLGKVLSIITSVMREHGDWTIRIHHLVGRWTTVTVSRPVLVEDDRWITLSVVFAVDLNLLGWPEETVRARIVRRLCTELRLQEAVERKK